MAPHRRAQPSLASLPQELLSRVCSSDLGHKELCTLEIVGCRAIQAAAAEPRLWEGLLQGDFAQSTALQSAAVARCGGFKAFYQEKLAQRVLEEASGWKKATDSEVGCLVDGMMAKANADTPVALVWLVDGSGSVSQGAPAIPAACRAAGRGCLQAQSTV